MRDLAEQTGGEAFYNTNGLLKATERAASDGENYYTLLYTPPAGAKPGEFRPVQVKVNRPGLQLSYRRGYYTAELGAAHRGGTLGHSRVGAIRFAGCERDSAATAARAGRRHTCREDHRAGRCGNGPASPVRAQPVHWCGCTQLYTG